MSKQLFKDHEWTFELLDKTWDVIDNIAKTKYNLDYYTPQIEVISSDQMLDAYCSHAMPVMYNHWSFGKAAEQLKQQYDQGIANLAYEIVINTDPCIAYLMESNDMVMQTLVMAHASVGHSSFFKTNYMFQEHTNAKSILDYLKFGKVYIDECCLKYGIGEVENLIDACHALSLQSIDRYPRKRVSQKVKAQRARDRVENDRTNYDPLLDSLVKKAPRVEQDSKFPEDNLLYFIEKNSLVLAPWKKEVIRIIRTISQYFYPQMLTKTMNEGTATFWHYTIMKDLHDEGYLDSGQLLHFLQSHTAVVNQMSYDSPYYSGLNPYALGFGIYQDVRRICENPTKEDREYMPHLIGQNWLDVVKDMTASYKDSSLIANFLSPKVVRDLKLFCVHDDPSQQYMNISYTHDKEGFQELRRVFSSTYDWDYRVPSLQVEKYTQMPPYCRVRQTDYLDRQLDQSNTTAAVQDYFEELMGCKIDFILNQRDL